MATFDKSEIMNRAWEIYKAGISFPTYSGRERFARCLRSAWQEAHAIVARAFYAAQSIAHASMSQVEQLQEEISMLQFKSSRINICDRRAHLQTQIERLAA